MTAHDPTSGPPHAVIVGGSLAGLVTGLALARAGLLVTILERSGPDPRYGGALGVDAARLARVTGVAAFGRGSSELLPWTALRASLRRAAEAHPRIDVHHATPVIEVGQDDYAAWAVTRDGRRFVGDLVLGADGHRSLVRRHVAPEQPDATFAGYVSGSGWSLKPHSTTRAASPLVPADGGNGDRRSGGTVAPGCAPSAGCVRRPRWARRL